MKVLNWLVCIMVSLPGISSWACDGPFALAIGSDQLVQSVVADHTQCAEVVVSPVTVPLHGGEASLAEGM